VQCRGDAVDDHVSLSKDVGVSGVMTVVRLSGTMQPTEHAKRLVAVAMFVKGKAFAAAAVLLNQQKRLHASERCRI